MPTLCWPDALNNGAVRPIVHHDAGLHQSGRVLDLPRNFSQLIYAQSGSDDASIKLNRKVYDV